MKLIVNTDSDKNGQELANFLRSVGYVNSVQIEKSDTPLTESDWCMPGRAATDKEIEALAKEMDVETGCMDSKVFFEKLRKNLST